MIRAAALALLVLVACKHSATGVPACDEHLGRRRVCAKQIGGELGAGLAAEADRLEQLWSSAAQRDIKDWSAKYGRKWCRAAAEEARLAFPECRW